MDRRTTPEKQTTALAETRRFVLIGMRNAGKSSLMNKLFDREVSIVSNVPGTTTDPVTRKLELGKLGTVSISDTAGLDDFGELGSMRTARTWENIKASSLYIFVTPANSAPAKEELEILKELTGKENSKNKLLCVLTHSDKKMHPEKLKLTKDLECVYVDNMTGNGIDSLKQILINLSDQLDPEITPLEGLVTEGDLVILVTPIDLAAPRGRLIMPQVETIRDLLDRDCGTLIVKERELNQFYNTLKVPPKLVITDSQAFHKVAADIPENQLLTSFSILFARKKGDLEQFIKGIINLSEIPDGGRVHVMESCSHHRQADDIGTVKIPRLFRQLVNSKTRFSFSRSLPEDEELKSIDMIIHCAACMINRNKMISRLKKFDDHNIYVTNYGLFLGWVNGLLPRALEPFTDLYIEYKDRF